MNTDRILRRGPAALAAVLAICLTAVGIFVAAPAAVAVEPPLRPQVIDLPAPPDPGATDT